MLNDKQKQPGEWIANTTGQDVSELGYKVALILHCVFNGIHNAPLVKYWDKSRTNWNATRWIEVTVMDYHLTTFDHWGLTKLVMAAHASNVRIKITASTHGYIKIHFMEVTRSGFFADEHPTLDQAIDLFDEHFKSYFDGIRNGENKDE